MNSQEFESWKKEIKKDLPGYLLDRMDILSFESFDDVFQDTIPSLEELVIYLRGLISFEKNSEIYYNSFFYTEDIKLIKGDYILESLLYKWLSEKSIDISEEERKSIYSLRDALKKDSSLSKEDFREWVGTDIYEKLVQDGLSSAKKYECDMICNDYNIPKGMELLCDLREEFITKEEYKNRWEF